MHFLLFASFLLSSKYTDVDSVTVLIYVDLYIYCCVISTIHILLCNYRERQAAGKLNRKMEKKLKEQQLQSEEDRRHSEQCKEQVRVTHNITRMHHTYQ